MTLVEFLTFLTTSGGVGAAVGVLLSVSVEYWPEFNALSKRDKRAVFFTTCMLVPFVAAIVLAGWNGGQLTTRELTEFYVWPALVNGFAAFTSGTLRHRPNDSA
jgi:uncharacterized membrane protein (DUF485 family)